MRTGGIGHCIQSAPQVGSSILPTLPRTVAAFFRSHVDGIQAIQVSRILVFIQTHIYLLVLLLSLFILRAGITFVPRHVSLVRLLITVHPFTVSSRFLSPDCFFTMTGIYQNRNSSRIPTCIRHISFDTGHRGGTGETWPVNMVVSGIKLYKSGRHHIIFQRYIGS